MKSCGETTMKYIKILAISSLLFSVSLKAIDLGSIDTSFSQDGMTDGWDVSNNGDFNSYASAVAIDSQGRIYMAGTYEVDFNGNPDKRARIERRLPNGDLDTSFDSDGIRELGLPPAPGAQFNYSLEVNSSDGVLVGYSRLFCITDNDCESEIYIYHINANGIIVGSQQIEFDLGPNTDRKDDNFADMVYIRSQNKLAIVAEVENANIDDTDFGIALLDVNPTSGALSLDTNFSSDGKAICFFDQQNPNGSQDSAKAIAWDSLQNHIIVGGHVFEGNGINADGYNLGFCEFDLSGSLLTQWSTQSQEVVIDNREFLFDMEFVNQNNFSTIVVSASLPENGGFDFALTRFDKDIFGDWSQDTTFGSNGSGWETTPFQFLFVGDTDDNPAQMVIEEDGNILVAGTASWDDGFPKGAIAMAKYTADGILNTTWGIGQSGKVINPLTAQVPWLSVLAMDTDPNNEEIYVSGFIYDGLNFDSLIANFHNDSIFASNFDF